MLVWCAFVPACGWYRTNSTYGATKTYSFLLKSSNAVAARTHHNQLHSCRKGLYVVSDESLEADRDSIGMDSRLWKTLSVPRHHWNVDHLHTQYDHSRLQTVGFLKEQAYMIPALLLTDNIYHTHTHTHLHTHVCTHTYIYVHTNTNFITSRN